MEWIELSHEPKLNTLVSFWLSLLRAYFRVEIEGLEHLPKGVGAIIAPNHSGFAGADAALLAHIIKRETKRRPRMLAHRAYFDVSKTLKELSESFGLKRACFENGLEVLNRKHLLIVFPEGEAGNFKSSLKRYELQRFHTGFIRMAVETGAPIIPCAVVGAEESNFNLGNIDLTKWVKGLRIPLPVNLLPLPAKWKIKILPPVNPKSILVGAYEDKEKLQAVADSIQEQVKQAIKEELDKRPYIYTEKTREWFNQAATTVQEWIPNSLLKRIKKKTRKSRHSSDKDSV